ncbi:MAG: cupredoxin domain-containing protein [Hahellaceae bacterium]|nr:cupredoxin domain-containing protein [Hahellaceae bacterium]MCP5169235.1 cupredoxin domain-containing protein [Hahellaceae bacterium]
MRLISLILLTALPLLTQAALPVFDLELHNGQLTPARLEIPAQTRVKIKLRNTGHMPAEFESRRLRLEKVLAPGMTSFVVINPLNAGEFEFFDEFHLPEAKGLIVVQ